MRRGPCAPCQEEIYPNELTFHEQNKSHNHPNNVWQYVAPRGVERWSLPARRRLRLLTLLPDLAARIAITAVCRHPPILVELVEKAKRQVRPAPITVSRRCRACAAAETLPGARVRPPRANPNTASAGALELVLARRFCARAPPNARTHARTCRLRYGRAAYCCAVVLPLLFNRTIGLVASALSVHTRGMPHARRRRRGLRARA